MIALHPGVECLTLDRDSFNQLIGDLSEIKEKDYGDEERLNKPSNTALVEQIGIYLFNKYIVSNGNVIKWNIFF